MPEFLEFFASGLELLLNIIEFIALCLSFGTVLFLMLNKFNKGLKIILSPCGIGLATRLKVLFVCRSSFYKKRAFIEFALLKTQGYGTPSAEWKLIVAEFKNFYAENQSDLKYEISNCTALIGTDFSAAVKRYFDYLNQPKVKKAFGIRDDIIEWVIKIHIREAYTTPTCLLTGLLSQYEENWEEFIKRYVSTAYSTDLNDDCADNILTTELYFTFGWLLWGPSYELDYKNYWAGLCQLSYGDEANSVPAVANINTDIMQRLREKFIKNENKRYGALISADVSLFEKKPYYKNIREFTNPENLYFYDKIENDKFSFAVQLDEFFPCMNFKSKKYYCTAYVWLLFELENDDSPEFRPEKCVAFFEHANLTDKDAYNFLTETLIDKSLKHFESVFADEKLKGRKYRFVTALNDKIAQKCIARYQAVANDGTNFGKALKERVILEPKRTPSVVFSAFDSFFADANNLQFTQVNSDNKKSISELAQFYTEIYLECFTYENERETFDNLMSYLKKAKECNDYKYHIITVKNADGEIAGGAIFDYFKRTNCAVIEFIAVKESMQACGIGSALYKEIYGVLSCDANENKKNRVDNIFCEIDRPDRTAVKNNKYLYFWSKNNFKKLKFDYVQPALSASQQPVDKLWLTVTASRNVTEFPSDVLLNVLYDYLKYCMQIKDPAQNAEYIKMKEQLSSSEAVGLEKIIEY